MQDAILAGDVKQVEELLSSGTWALPHWTFPNDEHEDEEDTLLLMAARAGHVEVARVLLDRGADMDRPSSTSYKTPLLEAVLAGQVGRCCVTRELQAGSAIMVLSMAK